jgi:hypothetical protein
LFQKSTTISKFNFLLIDETISATWGGGRIAPQFWVEKTEKPKPNQKIRPLWRDLVEKLKN